MKRIAKLTIAGVLAFAGLVPQMDRSSLPSAMAEEAEEAAGPPALYIAAINPGYTTHGDSEHGEIIEIRKTVSEEIALSRVKIYYTNGGGTRTELLKLPSDKKLSSEKMFLAAKSSSLASGTTLLYSTSLALGAGPLEIWLDGAKIDAVCWNGDTEKGCTSKFVSKSDVTLERNEKGEMATTTEYEAKFSEMRLETIVTEKPTSGGTSGSGGSAAGGSGSGLASGSGGSVGGSAEGGDGSGGSGGSDEAKAAVCAGLKFSEIYTYYAKEQGEQYFELYNPTAKAVALAGCAVKYKKKTYAIGGTVPAGGYLAFYPGKVFSLTKNPTTENTIELIDADGTTVDALDYPHGQRKGAAYAKFGEGEGDWELTFAPTPGAKNIEQEYPSCESGKVYNPETGRCVKDTTASTTTALAECPAGKYRNPETGRCKKIETASATLAACAEGYERNPETNRCRKIKTTNDGAAFALEPTQEADGMAFTAIWVVAALVALAVGYIVLQFRREIARAARKTRKRLHNVFINLVARKSGGNGN